MINTENPSSPGTNPVTAAAQEITVEIMAKKNSKGELRISDIKYTHGDTEAIAGPALNELATKVKNTQSIDVDVVAGATYSSEGFIQALEDACSKIK